MAAHESSPGEPRDAAARWRVIIEAALDSIVTIDERGCIDWCNPATEKIFGYRTAELIGQNVSVLMPEPDRSHHDQHIRRYLRTGERRIIGVGRQVIGRRKDGTLFPLDLAVTEFQIDGRPHFVGIMRDVHDKKLSEQRALQAERLAAIGQMVTGLMHESRNALQRTEACLEILEEEVSANSTAQDLIQHIRGAQEDLRTLFEEVRDFAKPLPVQPQPCSLASTWREAWALLSVARQDRDARLTETLPADDPMCLGDLYRLVQVFRNLLENALAAAADPVEIHIGCEPLVDRGRSMWRVVVHDNGPGLAPEQFARVFEPFYTTKRKGSGLGLPIARRILEAHQGSLEAVPAERGAQFELRVPQYHGSDS